MFTTEDSTSRIERGFGPALKDELFHTPQPAVARRRSDLGIADLAARRFDRGMRLQKITFGEMGVRGVLVYCADYHCNHIVALNANRWPDEIDYPISSPGLSARFVKRGAILRGGSEPGAMVGLGKPELSRSATRLSSAPRVSFCSLLGLKHADSKGL